MVPSIYLSQICHNLQIKGYIHSGESFFATLILQLKPCCHVTIDKMIRNVLLPHKGLIYCLCNILNYYIIGVSEQRCGK